MIHNRFVMPLLVASLLAPLAACQSRYTQLPALDARQSLDAEYRLGPGDKVSITVLNAPDLSGSYTIGDNGTISTPLIGDLKAVDLTRVQLEQVVTERLAQNVVKDPKVNVAITSYRPFYILGEVARAGAYPYASGMRALSAIATAGGYTPRARQDFVIVDRRGEEWKAAPSTPILPDDIIRIPERAF